MEKIITSKKKWITFVGKLNKAKGYDVFASAIKKVLNQNPNWKAKIIGDEKIAQNKLFVTNDLRNKNLSLLRKQIEIILTKKKKEFWIKKLQENQIPCSHINTVKDLFNNKQIENRGMIKNYSDDIVKSLKVSGNPIKLSFLK